MQGGGQGGWGAPPPQGGGGWGAPPPQGGGLGLGAPPPQGGGGWGAPPPQGGGGWGAPPPQGWGAPPPQGWGAPPPQSGWGAPPPQGWGAPPPQGFGMAPPQGYGREGFGVAPPQQQGFGMAPPQGFGAPPQQGFGVGPPQGGLGVGGGHGAVTTTVTTVHHSGASHLHFFNHVNNHLQRDYILIIDKSGSMAGSNWREAQKAVAALAPSITRCDPDGITIYFFSSRGSYPKYTNVTTPEAVENAFRSQSPSGTTCLDGVLQTAFDEHFRKGSPTTILVITDGEPDDRRAVERVIKDAANRLQRDEELSISFIQIGHDSDATKFLKKLDDELAGAKFDIVDAETAENMKGMDFATFIGKSIGD